MKHSYKIFFIIMMILAFSSFRLIGQQIFSISQINTTKFPEVEAGFVAYDAAGKPYTNLDVNQFTLKENGRFISPPNLRLGCVDSIVEPSASIILVVDQSGSMGWTNDSGRSTRWNWVLDGAKAFIDAIKFANGTKIAIISFGRIAYLRCGFTDNRQELKDSLDNINIGGGTLYDPPLLDRNVGACEIYRRFSDDPRKRRIVVFLTDGEPNTPPPVPVDSILRELNKEAVQLYGITLAMPMHPDLAKISTQSGGRYYSVQTKKELHDIYTYIALEIQRVQFCSLYWTSPFGCDELSRNRKVSVTFNPLSATVDREYYAPPTSIARVDLSDNIVSFGDPPANGTVDKFLTLSPQYAPFNCTNMFTQPGTYFQIISYDTSGKVTAPPFTIDAGKSQTMQLRFTQGPAKGYRQATLVTEGDPCPLLIPLVGGISQIKIINPNGKEVFSTCDTINIQWAGIDPTTPVNLSYSRDNGLSWSPIANNVIGSFYRWKPPQPGLNYRIRGLVSPVSSYMWARSEGGIKGDDIATSLACVDNEYFVYVCGHFEDTVAFASKVLRSRGSKDIWVAKYDRDGGLIWVTSVGGPGIDTASGICVDPSGNAYITGMCQPDAQFGNITPNMPIVNGMYLFVAKFPPGGTNPSVEVKGPDGVYFNFKIWGQKIRYIKNVPPALDEIWVLGQYIGQMQSVPQSLNLPRVTLARRFTAIFYPDFTLRTAGQDGIDYADYSKPVDYDVDGNKYECGSFSTSATFGSYKLTSKGKKDAYIVKWGGTPGSIDLSDTNFKVESPQLSLKYNRINFKDCTMGGYIDSVALELLCNLGTLPIEILSTSFGGNHPQDFSLGSSLAGLVIKPGECVPVEILFTPKGIGARAGQLIINGACNAQVVLDLEGNGICSGITVPLVDFKNVTVNAKKDSTIYCVFKNTNPQQINVKPIIQGLNAVDFSIVGGSSDYLVMADSCLTLSVSFTPSQPGRREAEIFFESKNCVLPKTQLIGNGVAAEVEVRAVDWKGRRVLTVNDSFVVIKNTSITKVKILWIDIQNKAGNIFEIHDLSAPFEINSGESVNVPVRFTPAMELQYSNTLMLTVENRTDTLFAQLNGDGILPKLATNWICDQPTKPGETSIASFEIINTSTSADLHIKTMQFSPVTADFGWENGIAPADFIVSKNSTKQINVMFTPQASGLRDARIKITSDAAPGPEVDPSKDTLIPITCSALGLSVAQEQDFGGAIVCDDEYFQNVVVTNTSGNADVTVIGFYFEGADSVAFTVKPPANMTMKPGEFINIPVYFSPKERRSFSTVLHIVGTMGIDVKITLKGIGKIADIYANPKIVKSFPGLTSKIPVLAKIEDLGLKKLLRLTVLIKFETRMVQLVPNSIKSSLTNWVWTPDVSNVANGILKVSGSGVIDLPFDGELFTPEWKIFLNEFPESQMIYGEDLDPCPIFDTDTLTLGLRNVCYLNGTLVVSGGAQYALSVPAPNPANDKFNLELGVGLDDSRTSLEIYNSMGELVRTIVEQELKAGYYEYEISTTDLSSGIYLIKLKSGPFSATETLLISK